MGMRGLNYYCSAFHMKEKHSSKDKEDTDSGTHLNSISTAEAGVRGLSRVQPGLHSETLSQKKISKILMGEVLKGNRLA